MLFVEPAPIELPIGAALDPKPIKLFAWWAKLLAIEFKPAPRPPIRLFMPLRPVLVLFELELRPRPIGA